MATLKEKFGKKGEALKKEVKEILKENGDKELGTIKLSQPYSGMRGMIGLVHETSLLDADEGIHFRGYSLPYLIENLPRTKDSEEPLPEGIFYLMLIGELPKKKDVEDVSASWARRSHVPNFVFDTIESLPKDAHPMTQFSTAVMAMQTESEFAKAYKEGISKTEYWEYIFEDCMNLIARLPRVAAYIYRRTYKDGVHIQPKGELDWSANFAHMLGFDDASFTDFLRLYLTIHCDHEGGNVSAHTTHLVGSALSDPYLAFASGMNGLAGPLHGLANQMVIDWIDEMYAAIGTNEPTEKQIAEYVLKTLEEGRVVPGYGHAVLRKTDPRFSAQEAFAKKHMADDKMVQTVWKIYDVVPDILLATGKVKNPWPNVDAHSGAILRAYGLVEEDFYTVLFGVSRALGVLAALCWDRVLGLPLERPKSISTRWVTNWLDGKDVN